MTSTFDSDDYYRTALAFARAQDAIGDLLGDLALGLDQSAGMAAGLHTAPFADLYDPAARLTVRGLAAAHFALGEMATALIDTVNTWLAADHAGDALTVHATPLLLPGPGRPPAVSRRLPPLSGSPTGEPAAELLAGASATWRRTATVVTDQAAGLTTAMNVLGERSSGPEADAAARHWLLLGGHAPSLLLTLEDACGVLTEACSDLAFLVGDSRHWVDRELGLAVAVGAWRNRLQEIADVLYDAPRLVPRLGTPDPAPTPLPALDESPTRARLRRAARSISRPPQLDPTLELVALLSGGRSLYNAAGDPGQLITLPGQGSTEVHVLGGDDSLIQIVGPRRMRHLERLVCGLELLRAVAITEGAPARAYFPRGAPDQAVDEALRLLGSRRVHLFTESPVPDL
ncbi:hypothetical protein ACFZB9_22900 [Kitasatospora sp. NPDC008050]|uniref:hypothetical protein n=1 Tax=Kitasatospora sp. NPDC008050 TaxID=3364021 RepID=UPI0036F08D08